MTRPVRVLVIDHTGELGGAELALVRLCEALGSEARVRCLLFAPGPLAGLLRAAGVPVEVVPLGGAGRGSGAWAMLGVAARLLPFQLRLARRLRALRPDVVHTMSLRADLLALAPARAVRVPLVWYVHDRIAGDYLSGFWVRVLRWAARAPARVLANSRATAETLGVPSVLAYPGFAPQQGIAPGRPVPPRPAAPVVGIVGRISPTKGQLEFVRAAATVAAAHPGARFRIVGAPLFGAGAYAAEVVAEAERLGIADLIDWTGQVQDTADELDAMSVCVHASTLPEPFGQVIVEAMARGVPVVATMAGGVPEIVVADARARAANATGAGGAAGEPLALLVPPADTDALAGAIVAVLDDPDGAWARAERARRSVYERFEVARTARVVSSTWRAATRSSRSPRP